MTNLQREPTKAELDEMVRRHFPTGEYAAEPLAGGMINTSYRIRFAGGGEYVLRIGPPDKSIMLPYESHLPSAENLFYDLCRGAGLPVPRVAAFREQEPPERDYMFTEYIPARALCAEGRTAEERAYLRERAGKLAAKMHAVRGGKFGRLTKIANGGGYARWSEALLAECGEWAESAERAGIFAREETKRVRAVFGRFAPLLDEITEPRLVHADLWDGNVLARDDGKEPRLWLIDGDHALFGDVNFEFATGWMLCENFLRGYGTPPLADRANETRKKLYKLLFAASDAFAWQSEYLDGETSAARKRDALALLAELEREAENYPSI